MKKGDTVTFWEKIYDSNTGKAFVEGRNATILSKSEPFCMICGRTAKQHLRSTSNIVIKHEFKLNDKGNFFDLQVDLPEINRPLSPPRKENLKVKIQRVKEGKDFNQWSL